MRQVPCDQCGRAVTPGENGTLICPSCGRAAMVPADTYAADLASADDPATRPVSPEVAAATSTAAAPPLPPAAQDRPIAPPPPRDPATQPATPYGKHDGKDDLPSLPRSHAAGSPPPDATMPLPPELAAQAGASGDRDAPRKRSGATLLSAIALLIVLALGSAGAVLAANGRLASLLDFVRSTPTPAATATAVPGAGQPTAPAGFVRYRASDGTFFLDVPAAWTHQAISGSSHVATVFSDPTTGANFEIDAAPQTADPAQHDQLALTTLADFLAASSKGTRTITADGPSDALPVAGSLWTRETADIAVAAGGQTATWHVVALSAQHNGSTLLVLYFAPQAVFPHEDAAHFQTMLDSLELVSPGP
jgi:hypothetical protein